MFTSMKNYHNFLNAQKHGNFIILASISFFTEVKTSLKWPSYKRLKIVI